VPTYPYWHPFWAERRSNTRAPRVVPVRALCVVFAGAILAVPLLPNSW
jgi:hypothetical protein